MDTRAVGMLFPGYGSQYVGMGKDFYDAHRSVQELFEQAGDCTGVNLVKLCFASSENVLAKPLHAYLSLFVVQSSIYTVLRERGLDFVRVGGWGVGTVSAHYAAGVLTFPDALYLLRKYIDFFTQVMARHGCVVMRVSGVPRVELERYLADPSIVDVVLAIVFAEQEYRIVGSAAGIARLKELLAAHQVQIADAPFSYGLHLLDRAGFVRVLSMYLAKIDCYVVRTHLITQSGVMHARGARLTRAAVLEPLLGPIEVERASQLLQPCSLVVHVGQGHVPLAVLQRYMTPASAVVVKTVADMKRIIDGTSGYTTGSRGRGANLAQTGR